MEDHKNHHYLIMEYCPNGTLLNLLERRKRLHELEVQFLLQVEIQEGPALGNFCLRKVRKKRINKGKYPAHSGIRTQDITVFRLAGRRSNPSAT